MSPGVEVELSSRREADSPAGQQNLFKSESSLITQKTNVFCLQYKRETPVLFLLYCGGGWQDLLAMPKGAAMGALTSQP